RLPIERVHMLSHSFRKGLMFLGLVSGALLAAPTFAEDYEPARLPSGKPDFNGVWHASGGDNYAVEPHSARAALAFREGPFGPVPAKEVVALGAVGAVPASPGIVVGGEIPYKKEALEQRNANREGYLVNFREGDEAGDPELKCYLPGIPRANYMPYAFQIFHNDDALFFAYEYAGAVRNVFLEDP